MIADIHFNHTLALKALDAGAHCVRLNPGNIGGPEKVARGDRAGQQSSARRCASASTRARCPSTCAQLEYDNPVEALVTAAVETVELMERLDFTNFKVSMKSTSVPNTIAANRLLSERIPYPLHLGVTEAGTKWSGSLKSAVGLGTLLADGIGDTIRISLSTFHAEEEVKVAWEILKALKLRERGPVLIACPTCGRLQFDMDTVVAEVERRLEAYEDPIEVSVLGCAVNGIGEARHADFGITGAKDMGMIYSQRRAAEEGAAPSSSSTSCSRRSTATTRPASSVVRDETAAAEARAWLAENEDATAMTPERHRGAWRRRGGRAARSTRRSPRRRRAASPAQRSTQRPRRAAGRMYFAGEPHARPRQDGSAARAANAVGDLGPVDDVPPRVDVVRAPVLVLQVVGVLPHVDAEQRRLAVAERVVLVGASRRPRGRSRRARATTSPSRTG